MKFVYDISRHSSSAAIVNPSVSASDEPDTVALDERRLRGHAANAWLAMTSLGDTVALSVVKLEFCQSMIASLRPARVAQGLTSPEHLPFVTPYSLEVINVVLAGAAL